MPEKRREFLAGRGERLIDFQSIPIEGQVDVVAPIPLHPVLADERRMTLASLLGDRGNEVTLFPSFGSVPWPLLLPGNGHRFGVPGMNFGLAWHPMFWLGRDYVAPLYVEQADGDIQVLEGQDEWLYRLFLELEHSGLYDSETGTWVDVLATYLDIDIEQEKDAARVQSWIDGADDAALDAFSVDFVILNARERDRQAIGTSVNVASDEAFFNAEPFARWCLSVQCRLLSEYANGRGRLNPSQEQAPDATPEEIAIDITMIVETLLNFRSPGETFDVSGEPVVIFDENDYGQGVTDPRGFFRAMAVKIDQASGDGDLRLPDGFSPDGVLSTYEQVLSSVEVQIRTLAEQEADERFAGDAPAEITA